MRARSRVIRRNESLYRLRDKLLIEDYIYTANFRKGQKGDLIFLGNS